MNRRGFWALWLADAWLSLAFERGRAPSFTQALRAWLPGQRRRAQRWRRVGTAVFGGLMQAESACAVAGLNYPVEDAGQAAPWHLPERFWQIPPGGLPAHPLINPVVLAAAQDPSAMPNAAQALQALADEGAASVHWQNLPVLLDSPHPAGPPARAAVCLHLFYPELWPLFRAQCQLIPEPWDLFVTAPAFAATKAWHDIVRDQPRVRFLPVPNRGRDIAPWLQLLRSGALDGYEAVCKLHGKRSPHMQGGGDVWRDEMLQALLGSFANVQRILDRFFMQPELALLGPACSQRALGAAADWSKNRRNVQLLSRRLGLDAVDAKQLFFAGTMFWFRSAAFEALRSSSLNLADFPREMGQTEGTLAHAMERLVSATAGVRSGSVVGWPDQPS